MENFLDFGATITDVSIISECTASVLKDAASALKAGHLVAFPTETVYGLGVDAQNEAAVARIYKVKGRPKEHPLIVHISSIQNLDKWARQAPEYATNLAARFWPGPLTLILPKTDIAKDFITGGQGCVGIRVPDQSIAQALLKEFENRGGFGVAAPSANRFGKVSPTSAKDVEDELAEYLGDKDLILNGGICQVGLESTIIDCRSERPNILRPGAITKNMIEEAAGIEVVAYSDNDQIKVSGVFKTHYAPKASIFLAGNPDKGDGFIALAKYNTPEGTIRLAAPKDHAQYAQQLYQALRLADQKMIKKIYVVPPYGEGLAIAINDRLNKAAFK